MFIKLYGMDQMIETLINLLYGNNQDDPRRDFAYAQFMTLLESTVEDLTKGFLAAARSEEKLSFGRIRNLVEEEIGHPKEPRG